MMILTVMHMLLLGDNLQVQNKNIICILVEGSELTHSSLHYYSFSLVFANPLQHLHGLQSAV